MFSDLYRKMVAEECGKADVLVFIHGFQYTFADSLEHIYQLHKIYVEPEHTPIKHLIYVSWPTIGKLLFTYHNDQEDAAITGSVLGRLYNKLFGFFEDMFTIHRNTRCLNKIHLAAHSMGNQVLKGMLQGIDDSKLYPLFSEVLLLNSDVEDTVFEDGQPFTRLESLCERVHIYSHKSDDALRVSRFTKNFRQRLGKNGPTNLETLKSPTFLVDTTSAKTSVNTSLATSIKENVADHWGYLYRQEVIEDIIQVLGNVDEDDVKNRKRWEGRYYYL